MILTCPECTTRFLLPSHALEPDGRRVKCSGCGEVWFQEPESEEVEENIDSEEQEEEQELGEEEGGISIDDIPEAVKPVPEDSSESVVQDDEERQEITVGALGGYIAAGGMFVVILAGLLLMNGPVMERWPASSSFYKVFGFTMPVPGEGLVFDKVTAGASKEGGSQKETIALEGQIINLTNESQVVPMIEAGLRSKSGEILQHWFIDPPKKKMDAEETLPFKAEYEGTHEDSREVHIRFVLGAKSDSKKSSEGGDSNPALHPDDSTHQNADAEFSVFPAPVSSDVHQESSPGSPGKLHHDPHGPHTDAPVDHSESLHH